MNKFAVLASLDKKVLSWVNEQFGPEENDPTMGHLTVMAWATNPDDWEVYEVGQPVHMLHWDGTFEELMTDQDYAYGNMDPDDCGDPVAIVCLMPSELENQIEYPIFEVDGVYIIGHCSGD